MKLPPYSPELNPIEQVWCWLRQHHLANYCFDSYEDILDACIAAWNDFVCDLKRVLDVSSTVDRMVLHVPQLCTATHASNKNPQCLLRLVFVTQKPNKNLLA